MGEGEEKQMDNTIEPSRGADLYPPGGSKIKRSDDKCGGCWGALHSKRGVSAHGPVELGSTARDRTSRQRVASTRPTRPEVKPCRSVSQELFEQAAGRRPAQAPTHYMRPETSRSKFRTRLKVARLASIPSRAVQGVLEAVRPPD
ncbi:hypothetical protein AG1IA_06069 [Rhizoctonia solani AG-1 IA]|uniref:Uncharacterized protein n=1 Tax=Thanatephorus cucumeris (strain AG1-IA) TaxID=983506 RepID=L8WP27_THACA|nr:hypothetical protein AG1IA_06069 [Rhizoctonia solani AG-1 IA]